jgi:hypothetical protein
VFLDIRGIDKKVRLKYSGCMVEISRGKLFHAFCVAYLGEHIRKPFCSVHREWFNLVDERKLGIAAPRGLAKSSVFSFFYPLFN